MPTRSMPTEDVERNLRFFTGGGPRVTPIDALVLSGVGAASRPDLSRLCDTARALGVRRITLHAGVEDLDALRVEALPVDLVVLPLQPAEAYATLAAGARVLEACRDRGLAAATNTVLTPAALPLLAAAARAATVGRVQSHGFTFPFPVDGQAEDVPPAPRAVAALRPVVAALEATGARVWIKGLPACYLGDLARLVHRSANRWYVDADHQEGKALMFFPDVVTFYKEEACRFCALDGRCDGFFATFLRRPGFPPLAPIEAA